MKRSSRIQFDVRFAKKCERTSSGLVMINLPFKVKPFEEYEIKFHDCCKWSNISSAFSAALRRKDPPTSHKSHTTSRTTKRWKPRQRHMRLKASQKSSPTERPCPLAMKVVVPKTKCESAWEANIFPHP